MIEEGIKVPSVIIPTLVKAAARLGLNVPDLLRTAGLDQSALKINDAVIPFATMNRFLAAMVELSEVPSIGLYIGSYLGFDYLPDFERFITTSATTRDAIKAIELFERFSPFYHFELKEKVNESEAHLVMSLAEECPQGLKSVYVEMFFTIIDRYGKIILGERYKLKKVVLGSRLNGPLFEYKKIFNAPIEAGAVTNALILDLSILDLALQNALPQAHEQAEQELRHLIKGALNKHGYKAKVLEAMQGDMQLASGSVAQLASFMNISVRGLQRKLKEEDATFSQLQLEARMGFAMKALAKNGKRIEELSAQLGFSNRRSFSRAFHQWYGTSPSTYRKIAQHGRTDA